MTDEQLDKVVKLKEEIKKRERIIREVTEKANDGLIFFGYNYSSISGQSKFNHREDKEILEKLANYYKVLQYLEIAKLAKEIIKIYPSYEITNPTILKALNETESMKKEIRDSLGNLGNILWKYV